MNLYTVKLANEEVDYDEVASVAVIAMNEEEAKETASSKMLIEKRKHVIEFICPVLAISESQIVHSHFNAG